MSINISYSKIYHQARILDTPEEKRSNKYAGQKRLKRRHFEKKKCIWERLSDKSSRTFIFLQTMNTYDIGACRQKSNPCNVWSGYTETLYAIFILPYFDNLYFLLRYPIRRSRNHVDLYIKVWLYSETKCKRRQVTSFVFKKVSLTQSEKLQVPRSLRKSTLSCFPQTQSIMWNESIKVVIPAQNFQNFLIHTFQPAFINCIPKSKK